MLALTSDGHYHPHHHHHYSHRCHYHALNLRVGLELWGSRAIGEFSEAQAEGIRSKRKVGDCEDGDDHYYHWIQILSQASCLIIIFMIS